MAEEHSGARRIGERIVRAMIVVGIFHVFWRLGGFLVAWLVKHLYGTTIQADAYFYATEFVLLPIYFIGEESLGPSFMPVFIREIEEKVEEKAWEFASTVLNLLAILLVVTVLVGIVWAPEIVRLVAPGFKDRADETMEMTTRLVRLMIPALLGLSLGSVTYVIINGYKVFGYPAAGDAVQRFLTFAMIGVGFMTLNLGLDATAVGVLAGAAGKILTHFVWLRRKVVFYRFRVALRSPAMRQFVMLMVPLLVGIVFARLRDFVRGRYQSYLAVGIPADVTLGRKVGALPEAVIPYALSIAIFPFLCDLWARRDTEGLGRVVTRGLDLVALFFVPLSITMIVLREPLVRMLFDRGHWEAYHVYYCSTALAVYASGLAFYAAEMVLMQSFFSMQNTWVPVGIGVLSSGLMILILFVTIDVVGVSREASFWPIVLVFPIGKVLKNVVLVLLMRRKVPVLPWATFGRFLARLAVVTVGCGASAYGAYRLASAVLPLPDVPEGVRFSSSYEVVKAVHLSVPSLAAVAAFLLLAWRLQMEEFQMVMEWVRSKLSRKGMPAAGGRGDAQ